MAEEFQGPKYQIGFEEAQGIAIGDGSMVIQQYHEGWLIQEKLDDVRSDSFVPPSKGNELLETLQHEHLLVLCGANRMGKAGLSRYIASLLEEERPILSTYRMRRRSEIEDMVDNLAREEHAIVLVYDLDPLELEDILQTIHEIALETGNFAILTADTPSKGIQAPIECQPCIAEVALGFPYSRDDLQQILADQIGDQLAALRERGISPQSLMIELGSPSQIVRFAGMLQAQPELPEVEELRELIRTLQDVGQEINRWLRGLDKNEYYLALALALLDDLPEKQFWTLYEEMIQTWQQRDPTLLPLDYYALDKFRSFVNVESRFSFEEPDVRKAVLDVLLGRYRRSLISILPLFERVARRDDGSDRVSRIAVAQAVGEIGTVEWADVEEVLLSWANHQSARVRASTSHAFQEMLDFSGLDLLQDVLETLDRWIILHDPQERENDLSEKYNVRWTVASSLGRMGRIVPRESFREVILPRLSELSRDDNYRVRKSVIYALRSLAISRFAEVKGILEERAVDWHSSVRSEVVTVLCRLGAMRWSETFGLLMSWLQGEQRELHWTALRTILILGTRQSVPIEALYEFADQDQDVRTHLHTLIHDILQEEETDAQTLSTLGALVRESAPHDSFLIIQPMVEALDYRLPNASQLIESWQSDSQPKLEQAAQVILEELEAIHAERKQRWQTLLENNLYDEEKLKAFANTLPPHERDEFWNDVRARRRGKDREFAQWRHEKEQTRLRKRSTTAIVVIVVFVLLCCILSLFLLSRVDFLGV